MGKSKNARQRKITIEILNKMKKKLKKEKLQEKNQTKETFLKREKLNFPN